MFVYIIYSKTLNSFYTGYCQDNLNDRILKHQQGYYDDSYTKKANDWELFWFVKCTTNAQALAIEKHIKKMKSSVYIQNLKTYPEIIEKLLLKYRS